LSLGKRALSSFYKWVNAALYVGRPTAVEASPINRTNLDFEVGLNDFTLLSF